MQQQCREEGLIPTDEELFYTLDVDNYALPFEDNTFDCIISFYVFEHVQNWQQALAEIQRVLKPGGACLHIFPSKYCPVEPHLFVPFGGVIQSRAYLTLWAYLGIKNSYQKQLSRREVAAENIRYLSTCTTYYSKAVCWQNLVCRKCVYRASLWSCTSLSFPTCQTISVCISSIWDALYASTFLSKGRGSQCYHDSPDYGRSHFANLIERTNTDNPKLEGNG